MIKNIGRKFLHFFAGLVLLLLYYLFGRRDALICYGLIILAILTIDMTRLKVAAFNRFMQKWFSSFLRENETNKLTGAAPYVLGVGLTLFFYQTGIATAAILFLVCGDVTATTVGERYGRTKIAGGKSLEGTIAFVLAAILSGVLLNMTVTQLPFSLLLIGAMVAAVVELLPLPLNDNLVIPMVSGGVIELIARITGFI